MNYSKHKQHIWHLFDDSKAKKNVQHLFIETEQYLTQFKPFSPCGSHYFDMHRHTPDENNEIQTEH